MQRETKTKSEVKKERFKSLDGLRGFAALGVFLSHSDFSIFVLHQFPVIEFLFRVLSSGLIDVQVLFVLSGFLMGSLYPVVKDTIAFWQKRYTRIFPVFIVIASFIWLANRSENGENWFFKLGVLLVLALIMRTLWLGFRKLTQRATEQKTNWSQIVFFVFLSLQAFLLVINIFITPHFIIFHQLTLPHQIKELLIFFSNITLTTPFSKGIPLLTGAFWSLAPEVLFYLLYPIIVLPLMNVGKKYGWLVSLVLVIGVTKILFDLQVVFLALYGLQSIKIARATGFMVGVILGSLNQSQDDLFLEFKKISSHWFQSLLILAMFAYILWLNSVTNLGVKSESLGWFYLLASLSIGAIIIASLTPKSFLNRVFSFQSLTFLGMVSYSFYLVHYSVILWGQQIMLIFGPRTELNFWYESGAVILELIFATALSWVLFSLVEKLYFAPKSSTKKAQQNSSKIKSIPVKIIQEQKPNWRTSILAFFACTIFFLTIYTGGYSPSILVTHISVPTLDFPTDGEISLLQHSARFSVKSAYANLSVVALRLKYLEDAETTRNHNSQPATLIFRLYDATGHKLFESNRHAYEIEGEVQFPFGFPTIADSAHQSYIAELVQENGDIKDQVVIDHSNLDAVAQYSKPVGSLPKYFITLIIDRILFAFQDLRFWFAIIFSAVVIFLPHKKTMPRGTVLS